MVDRWGEDAPVAVAWEHDSELVGSTAGRLLSDDAWRPGCPTLGRWHFGEDWSSQSRHVDERLKRNFLGKAWKSAFFWLWHHHCCLTKIQSDWIWGEPPRTRTGRSAGAGSGGDDAAVGDVGGAGLGPLMVECGHTKWTLIWWVPSGKHTKNYGKSPCLMGKHTINGHFQ
jgi:hypothetical protein